MDGVMCGSMVAGEQRAGRLLVENEVPLDGAVLTADPVPQRGLVHPQQLTDLLAGSELGDVALSEPVTVHPYRPGLGLLVVLLSVQA
jgi:hypothetical protein